MSLPVCEEAFELGQKWFEESPETCDPMLDPKFQKFCEDNRHIPLIVGINSYVDGWQEMYGERNESS